MFTVSVVTHVKIIAKLCIIRCALRVSQQATKVLPGGGKPDLFFICCEIFLLLVTGIILGA